MATEDVKLRVTMDASQARREAKTLHAEMQRRWKPVADFNEAWRNGTISDIQKDMFRRGLLQGPSPLAPMHSGIWWAKQKGIKGLGQPQYAHQFFSERDAKYMGLQFAKTASQEFKASAKQIGIAAVGFIASQGISAATNYYSHPMENNRRLQVAGSYGSGILGGALAGAGTGAMLGSVVPGLGTGAGAIAGLIVGGLGGALSGFNTQIGHRNEDELWAKQFAMNKTMMRWQRNIRYSDMALQKQMELSPSRGGKRRLLASQINQISSGSGQLSIKNLEGLLKAMNTGGTWKGRKYEKGDMNTAKGLEAQQMLQSQYSRREQLRSQKKMLDFTPHATPGEPIVDAHARRGLFVGGQVDNISTNREIISIMKKIYESLKDDRRRTNEINIKDTAFAS